MKQLYSRRNEIQTNLHAGKLLLLTFSHFFLWLFFFSTGNSGWIAWIIFWLLNFEMHRMRFLLKTILRKPAIFRGFIFGILLLYCRNIWKNFFKSLIAAWNMILKYYNLLERSYRQICSVLSSKLAEIEWYCRQNCHKLKLSTCF